MDVLKLLLPVAARVQMHLVKTKVRPAVLVVIVSKLGYRMVVEPQLVKRCIQRSFPNVLAPLQHHRGLADTPRPFEHDKGVVPVHHAVQIPVMVCSDALFQAV